MVEIAIKINSNSIKNLVEQVLINMNMCNRLRQYNDN